MALNKSKGNMYGFITHTWNLIRGVCPYQCKYCYMRKWWPNMGPPHLAEEEFKVNPGEGKTIFVGSSIDMWATDINWCQKVIDYCMEFDNTYLFQSKNPKAFEYIDGFPKKTILCSTIETNREYNKYMGSSPITFNRYTKMRDDIIDYKKMITIEPIMDFDLEIMVKWMEEINPIQINIGADSGNNNLPEPSPTKLYDFIITLKSMGFNVHQKDNLRRLLK